MSIPQALFPPLPPDTARAARAVFNLQNTYLMIGQQLDALFAGLELTNSATLDAKPASFMALLALVTIFQYAEDLTDNQAIEATRKRMEWKYALHLPMNYPGFAHWELCEFRQQLALDRAGRPAFQTLLDRVGEVSLLGSKTGRGQQRTLLDEERCSADAVEVLAAV